MSNVSNIVKSIQDIMRKDAGTYGDAQRLEQLGWMFFLKIFDDREQELELLRDSYRSPLPQHLRWSNWATDAEGITGEALLDFVNNSLLPKLKALTGGADSHSGRRTFATSLIERGVDIKAVSSLMGHSTVAMTARYVDDNPIRLRRVCEEVSVGV